MTKLRVALIGLGGIASKGYLPVLAADPDVEPVLITRDEATRERLAATWRTGPAYASLGEALAAGERLDAGFVHAATSAHVPLALELIAAGIPACVDKPLAFSAEDARQVVAAARESQVSLMVGFNRRFVPAYAEVAGWPGLDTVVLTKNRLDEVADPRVVVFDDFVHVVDTLRFLATPQPESVKVTARRTPDGGLARVGVVMRQEGRLAVGIMDRDSGATTEVLEAMAPGQAVTITDLAEVVERRAGVVSIPTRSGWTPVGQARGFVAMTQRFLTAVREGVVL
ncbi:MAG: Gfo/Idh/MocA family protein, partial [Candidatus Nanopelagicales bacterium]